MVEGMPVQAEVGYAATIHPPTLGFGDTTTQRLEVACVQAFTVAVKGVEARAFEVAH